MGGQARNKIQIQINHFSDRFVLSRVLIGVTDRSSAEDVSTLLSYTGVDLLISRVLHPDGADATERAQSIQLLCSSHNQNNLAWSLGGKAEGHLASLVGPALVKLHQLLLLTLPGTPVINYGDEICLMDEVRTLHCHKQIYLRCKMINTAQTLGGAKERYFRLMCQAAA